MSIVFRPIQSFDTNLQKNAVTIENTEEILQTQEEQLHLDLMEETKIQTIDSVQQFIQNVLTQAGIPQSLKNQEMVARLLEANQSVDKKSLLSFLKTVSKHPDIPIKDLVFFMKHEIPLKETHLHMAKEYRNEEHHIITQVEEWTSTVVDIICGESDIKLRAECLQQVLAQLERGDAKETNDRSNEEIGPSFHVFLEGVEQKLTGHELLKLVCKQFEQRTEGEGLPTKQESVREEDLSTSKEVVMSQELPREIQALIQRADVKQLLRETLIKNYTLVPEQLGQKENVLQLYDTMERDMEQWADVAKHFKHNEEASKLFTRSEHIKNNIGFMKTLSQAYPYIQIPIQCHRYKSHSELTVYTRRKGKRSTSMDQDRVLLHLDMEHLGLIDLYLHRNKKQLKLQFYVANKEVTQLFQQRLHELNDVLSEKGYQISSEFYPLEENINPMDHMEEQDMEVVSMKRYALDVRT